MEDLSSPQPCHYIIWQETSGPDTTEPRCRWKYYDNKSRVNFRWLISFHPTTQFQIRFSQISLEEKLFRVIVLYQLCACYNYMYLCLTTMQSEINWLFGDNTMLNIHDMMIHNTYQVSRFPGIFEIKKFKYERRLETP